MEGKKKKVRLGRTSLALALYYTRIVMARTKMRAGARARLFSTR